MIKNEEIALKRFQSGEKYSISTFIDEDSIIAGYGKLDYDFEFPLPTKIIIEKYGTTSWSQWFINQGLFKYKCINNNTGEEAITPYYNDDDIKIIKKSNPNFTFKKIK